MIKDNLVRLFEDAIRMHWDSPAMSDYGQPKIYTYGEVAAQIERLHILLNECGIEKNDKVALIGRNSCNWAMTYVAILTYGAVVVPILQDFKPGDVTHIINHSESKLLFAGDAIWENLDLHNMPEVRAVFSLTNFAPLAIQVRMLSEKELKAATKAAAKLEKAAEKAEKKLKQGKDIEVPDVPEVREEEPILNEKDLMPEHIEQLF